MVAHSGVRSDVWLRAAWEAASDAIALSDSRGTVLAANPAYFSLYGYGPEEVIGRPFSIIFPEHERPRAEALYREVFRSDVHPPAYEAAVQRRDGTSRVVEARVSFVEDEGQRVAMLNVIRDVTDEVAARAAAQEAERGRRTFLASVSHDIKTPLAAIKGHAQLLKRTLGRETAGPLAERAAKGLGEIESSVDRLARLVDELVEVAALGSGDAPPPQLEASDLVVLVGDAVARHQRLLDTHRLVMETEADSLPGWFDVSRIQRLLDNLLSNAVKYSPEGGAITVRVAPQSRPVSGAGDAPAAPMRDGATVVVRDQGIGIPPEDLPHVFESYRRGTNAGPTALGSGIGLTSVRHVVEQHGGRVEIASEVGRGTTVVVWLPLRQEEVLGSERQLRTEAAG